MAPKIVALILATAIWLLIRSHLISEGVWEEERPLRAIRLTPEQQLEAEELDQGSEQ